MSSPCNGVRPPQDNTPYQPVVTELIGLGKFSMGIVGLVNVVVQEQFFSRNEEEAYAAEQQARDRVRLDSYDKIIQGGQILLPAVSNLIPACRRFRP